MGEFLGRCRRCRQSTLTFVLEPACSIRCVCAQAFATLYSTALCHSQLEEMSRSLPSILIGLVSIPVPNVPKMIRVPENYCRMPFLPPAIPCLRPAHGHDLLRCADGSRAHADAQRVDAPLDEVGRLRDAHDVAAHDLPTRFERRRFEPRRAM